MFYDGRFPEYVSVAERRRRAEREVAKLRRKGRSLKPVVVEGRRVAGTVWGKAWCANLETYSDFENRLPRGRAYLLNGQVLDLEVEPGRVKALVSGTKLYTVDVGVKPLPKARWRKLVAACAGQVSSVVELLRGELSKSVMEVLCRPGEGLFPTPAEISFSCTCPDFASLCKHIAAALYGVGTRLDTAPELLFTLRQVDGAQLVTGAAAGLVEQATTAVPTLDAGSDLEGLFSIELAPGAGARRARGKGATRRPGTRRAPKRREMGSRPQTLAEGVAALREVVEQLTQGSARRVHPGRGGRRIR